MERDLKKLIFEEMLYPVDRHNIEKVFPAVAAKIEANETEIKKLKAIHNIIPELSDSSE